MFTKRHATFGFIFITVLLDMLSFGVIVPLLPKLISDFLNGNTARASEYIGMFTTTWALMQFIFAPVLGLLSDRFGRRPVILLSNFGLALDFFVMALAPSVRWLFLGRVLSGLTSASIPTATAYISDVTAPEKRSKAFGLLGAAFGAGFIFGPAIGGWLGLHNPRLPFWVAGIGSLVNFCYGLFVLPESLPREQRQSKLQWKNANPVGALRLLRRHAELFGLATVNFLGYIAHEIYMTVFVLYVTYRYGWNSRMVGISLAVVGVAQMATYASVGPIVERLGERRTLLTGLAGAAVGFALFGWPSGAVFLAAIPINALWSLAGSTSQSLMTQHVSAKEQGELQGALASLRGVAMLIGPGLFSLTFAYFISPGHVVPGAPWYLASALLIISLAIAWAVAKDKRSDKDKSDNEDKVNKGLAPVEAS
ncbi:MAG: TCR/Tet family MFS transporter [Terriglobales bacterium]|jgi:DHA1 family tetracycline resistance protein-like MFS transporter